MGGTIGWGTTTGGKRGKEVFSNFLRGQAGEMEPWFPDLEKAQNNEG